MKYQLKKFKTEFNVSRIANIHYFEFTTQYQTIKESHNFCELLYVDNGEITVEAENYNGILSDNQLIIHQPNEVHSLTCSTSIAPNVIIIGFECNFHELKTFSKNPFTLSLNLKKVLSEVMQEGMSVFEPPYNTPNIRDMKKRESYPFGADQMLKLKLEMFFINLIRETKEPSQKSDAVAQSGSKLEDIYRYVSEHYNSKITLDNICFLFGTNKTTLCKSFKQEYGITIFNYINQLKINEAKVLLRENKLSVTEISDRLGFNSIHYFSRMFKMFEHQSPSEYIKTIRSRLNL